jgi:penicillin-binding protein 1A
MSVVHTNRNIPTIPGLTPHPAQVAEQQRLAELKRTDPSLAQAQMAHATQKKSSIMADQTRDALRRLADGMRRAGSPPPTPVSSTPVSTVAPAQPASPGAGEPNKAAPK